jgi:hypothetical protein
VSATPNEHPAYQASLARLRDADVHITTPASSDLEAFDQGCLVAADWLKLV